MDSQISYKQRLVYKKDGRATSKHCFYKSDWFDPCGKRVAFEKLMVVRCFRQVAFYVSLC